MLRRLIIAFFAVAFAIPGSWSCARADHLPFAIGLGEYIPVSPSANVEGLSTLPGTTVRQTGNLGIELSVGPQLHPGSYQISAMILSQRQSVTPPPVLGLGPGNEHITQIPIMLEDASHELGVVRFGGGLGYNFVSYPSPNGSRAGSGIVGDTFVLVGAGSGTALEAKYFFGQRAALSGIFVGITTRL
jgi:hypothetical protein